jgi:putative hydrolase of the HAD superfamily
MRVQAIFFDLDDTLVDDAASFRLTALRACSEIDTGIEAALLTEAYVRVSDEFWRHQPWVSANFEAIRVRLWQDALRACGCDESGLAAQISGLYSTLRREICEVYEDTEAALNALAADYTLGVITNGHGDTQRDRLRSAGLDRYFDLIVAATDIDAGKPDPAIFEHALQGLRLDAAAVWHVGDRLDSDVIGALNVGLTAVWMNRRGLARDASHPEPHHEIASLSELQGLLR